MERHHIHLAEGYVFNPYGKTKAARRKLPLSRRAADVLLRHLSETQGPYVFPATRWGRATSKPLVKLNNGHHNAVKRAELQPFRLYDLRHIFATRAAEAGIDLVTLAALLGHSRVQMVMRYAHPSEKHQFKATRTMEASREAKTSASNRRARRHSC